MPSPWARALLNEEPAPDVFAMTRCPACGFDLDEEGTFRANAHDSLCCGAALFPGEEPSDDAPACFWPGECATHDGI